VSPLRIRSKGAVWQFGWFATEQGIAAPGDVGAASCGEYKIMIGVSTIIQNRDKEILLVQERKPAAYGKFNLPGGHLEAGEKITAGAIREASEEVNLEIELEYLLGVCGLNFVFFTTSFRNQAVAQKSEILDCSWFSVEALRALKDDHILNPRKFRMIIDDLVAGRRYPVEVIRAI
jgi:8-oxo-dGTP pyrophosphatase MutT (NUDIX family)